MTEQVKAILEKGVEEGAFPGATFCLVHHDGRTEVGATGHKSLVPKKEKNTEKTIYDVASLTKVVATTTMIMRLFDTGKAGLDTRVCTVLPRYGHKNTTIAELLTHTSGLPADIPSPRTLKTKEDVLGRIYAMDLIYEPETRIVYSDVGFILLGEIIEKITGKSLDVFARETIFTPLGMNDTGYHPDVSRTAPTEIRNDETHQGLLKGKVHDEKSFAMDGLSGHAGLFSTASDLGRFVLSILRNDTVLEKRTVDTLFQETVALPDRQGRMLRRSLGWDKPTPGGIGGDHVSVNDTILHTGFTGCSIVIDRKAGTGIVILSNGVHPDREKNGMNPYRRLVADVIYSKPGGNR